MSETFKFSKNAIEWRRNIVLKRLAQGYTAEDIAEELHLHLSTIYLDIQYIRETAKQEMKTFVTEQLPEAIATTKASLRLIIQKAWEVINPSEDRRVIAPLLNLIRECEKDRLDLYSNVNIVDQIVSEQGKQQSQPMLGFQNPNTEEPVLSQNLESIEEPIEEETTKADA